MPDSISVAIRAPARLAAVRETALLDAPSEPAFDRLTRLAARVLGARAVLVTLVDEERDFILGGVGLPAPVAEAREIHASPSFCQYAVATGKPLLLEDARAVPEFAEYPAVKHMGVVACANVPLVTAAGHAVGNFCVIEFAPRAWTEADQELLATLAAAAVTEIELRTALRAAEDRADLAREAMLARDEVLERVPDALFTLDADWRVTYVNQKGEAVLGESRAALLGRELWEIFPDADGSSFGVGCRRATVERRCVSFEAHFPHLARWHQVHADPSDAGLSVYFRDITERKALEEQLSHQALHDPLTGLANRVLFRDRVGHALSFALRRDRAATVFFLDLDDFKRVNDSLGHAAGDGLLVAATARLQQCLRPCDTAARLGGDEFALLVEDLADPAEAVVIAERILTAFSRPFLVGVTEVCVAASIGIARAAPGEGPEELLRNADLAMYTAKRNGKGRTELFEPAMHAAVLRRLELEADLRRAVDRDEFTLRYQPIVALDDARVVGVEALVRWNHPVLGLVAPLEFIPLAEETGLIVPLGRWVLREACRQAALWQAARPGGTPLAITVNISGRQLQEATLLDDVAAALRESGLPPSTLTLEITESVLMQNGDEMLGRLRALKVLGVRLAIDDFGTGYSSLSYLQQFPVDVLKIDKAFVDTIASGSEGSALARAIIDLGRTLHLRTVAEGIEGGDQRARLQELGCEYGQGYHFAKPLGVAEMDVLLAAEPAGDRRPAFCAPSGGVQAR